MYTKSKNFKKLRKTNLKDEANAFSKRIKERTNKGFIPDLRKLKFNDFFYKSFWRDPLFVELYILEIYKNFKFFFNKFAKGKKKILDIGCGSGYLALELAREGFEVTGVDISKKCIEVANRTAENEKLKGKLEYFVGDHNDLQFINKFDIILSSGFIHHLKDLRKFVENASKILKKGGILVWHEPQHKDWTLKDAGFVSSLRLILSNLGCWYEDLEKKKIMNYTRDVFDEFYHERDKNEKGGQSPNDLSCDKEEIIKEVSKKFKILFTKPSFSFIYRFLGGLRGHKKNIHSLSRLLYKIDKEFVENKVINANYFFGVAKK